MLFSPLFCAWFFDAQLHFTLTSFVYVLTYMQWIEFLLPNNCDKHTKKSSCIVFEALIEIVQQENDSAMNNFLETKRPTTNATSNKDNPKRLFSLLLFCTVYTQFFNKLMHNFIKLCSLLLWQLKPPHVSWFCDL